MSERSLPGLYLHVPFCSAICPYCDFAVRKGSAEQAASFVDGLLQEIRGIRSGELRPEALDLAEVLDELVELPFDTVYLGGGTPSFLSADQLASIFDALFRAFQLAPGCSFYLEANPEDVTPESVAAWQRLGITTLSLGVQSLDDDELKFLGRRHTAREAQRAVEVAKAGGFGTVSVDLIYGLTSQDLSTWKAQLERALELGADHLSLYELEIHARTSFGKRRARGENLQLSEDTQAALFLQTHELLRGVGWDTYEVSNFARSSEHRSRHNQKYWRHVPYLGLGPSAHSYAAGWRFWNERGEPPWRKQLADGLSPVIGWEKLPSSAIALEMLMLGLRTREGVELERLQSLLRTDFLEGNRRRLDQWITEGLVRLDGDRLTSTDRGFAVADRLAAELDLG